MTHDVDVEELQTTKSEKLLAVVMAAFLLLAGIWTYQEIDDRIRRAMPVRDPSPAEQAAIGRAEEAQNAVFRAQNAVRRARSELELRREAYRTALDEGRPAAALRRRYEAAVAAHDAARRAQVQARRALEQAQPAAAEANRRVAADVESRVDRQELVIFLVRAAAAVVFILLAYLLLARLRSRNSRYLPLAAAGVGFATVFAVVVAGDYVTDYVNPFDFGVLLLALLGVACTLAAFWVLQRYIARRLPKRRVRRRECPFCGFPIADNERCEGCGRTVVAPCASCDAPRRVGTAFCGACGQAA